MAPACAASPKSRTCPATATKTNDFVRFSCVNPHKCVVNLLRLGRRQAYVHWQLDINLSNLRNLPEDLIPFQDNYNIRHQRDPGHWRPLRPLRPWSNSAIPIMDSQVVRKDHPASWPLSVHNVPCLDLIQVASRILALRRAGPAPASPSWYSRCFGCSIFPFDPWQ